MVNLDTHGYMREIENDFPEILEILTILEINILRTSILSAENNTTSNLPNLKHKKICRIPFCPVVQRVN